MLTAETARAMSQPDRLSLLVRMATDLYGKRPRRQLAEALDCSPRKIAGMWTGETPIHVDTLLAVAYLVEVKHIQPVALDA